MVERGAVCNRGGVAASGANVGVQRARDLPPLLRGVSGPGCSPRPCGALHGRRCRLGSLHDTRCRTQAASQFGRVICRRVGGTPTTSPWCSRASTPELFACQPSAATARVPRSRLTSWARRFVGCHATRCGRLWISLRSRPAARGARPILDLAEDPPSVRSLHRDVTWLLVAPLRRRDQILLRSGRILARPSAASIPGACWRSGPSCLLPRFRPR